MLTHSEVEKNVEALFMDKMINYVSADRRGLHVSNLVYSCMRKGYWDMVRESTSTNPVRSLDEDQVLTFALGKMVHEVPITDAHETPLQISTLTGTTDEILNNEDGSITIIDKKTCTTLPLKPYEQHLNQIKYYAVMLYEKPEYKGKVMWGCVLYIQLGTDKSSTGKHIKAFAFPIDVTETREELIRKISIMNEAMKTKVPPDSTYSWLCNYCEWYTPCRLRDAKDKRWREFFPPSELPPENE
jgi:CRISPR/Cas system-associated exonuclease Cas4 (RecB family)